MRFYLRTRRINLIFIHRGSNEATTPKRKKMSKAKIEITETSNIAKILRGETKGYYDWYVKQILTNRELYIIKK